MAVQNKDDVDVDVVLSGYNLADLKIRTFRCAEYATTNILNLGKIVKALARPGFLATYFFAMELYTVTNFHRKTGVGLLDRYFDAAKISTTFEKFIKKFVECYACGSLETTFLPCQQHIAHKCRACDHLSVVVLKDRQKDYIWQRVVDRRLAILKQRQEGSHKISI